MRSALARLLMIVAIIPVWIGIPVGLFILPVGAGWIALDTSEPLWSFTLFYWGGWIAWVVLALVWDGAVSFLSYILMGSAKRAELVVESKLDRPEIQELLASGEYTKRSLIDETHAMLWEDRRFNRIGAWATGALIYFIGLGIVYWMAQ